MFVLEYLNMGYECVCVKEKEYEMKYDCNVLVVVLDSYLLEFGHIFFPMRVKEDHFSYFGFSVSLPQKKNDFCSV